MIKYLFISLIIIESLFSNSSIYFKLANEHKSTYNFNKAKYYYQLSCDANYARGCFELAIMYSDGKHIPLDTKKSYQFYKKSCNLDDSNGCLFLGISYEDGIGIKHSYILARERYAESCSSDNGAGCAKLGLLYLNGKGVDTNQTKASTLFKKACDLGSGLGCIKSSRLNVKYKGSIDDYNSAKKTYQERCSAFYPNACLYMGLLYTDKKYHDHNSTKSIKYLKKACKYNNLQGCIRLKNHYIDTNELNISSIYHTKIIKLQKNIVKKDNYTDIYDYKKYEFEAKKYIKKDKIKLYKLYKKACSLGSADSCYKVGRAYFEGTTLKQSDEMANKYLRKACFLDNSHGCSALGFLYEYAMGVEKDYSKAYRYYHRACSLKDKDGCQLLDLLDTKYTEPRKTKLL